MVMGGETPLGTAKMAPRRAAVGGTARLEDEIRFAHRSFLSRDRRPKKERRDAQRFSIGRSASLRYDRRIPFLLDFAHPRPPRSMMIRRGAGGATANASSLMRRALLVLSLVCSR